jgi:type III restriction enzyme
MAEFRSVPGRSPAWHRILVVEYKGDDRWSNDDSKEKRKLGELWAERSIGRGLFIMPCGRDFAAIRKLL